MRQSTQAVLATVALLAGCSTSAGPDAADPLADGCRVVEDHAASGVGQDDVAALEAFSQRLTTEADALSTSDAAELRPLARAASAVARAADAEESDLAYADYRRALTATTAVCEAAADASR